MLFILSGCNQGKFSKELPKDEDFIPPKEELSEIKEKKKVLANEWYTKISLTITKNTSVVEVLKSVSNKIGIKLFFNLKDFNDINYTAQNKPFIEVLSDIATLCEWRIAIKDLNCKILHDAPYFFSYSIPFLVGERKSTSDTSFSSNIASGGKSDLLASGSHISSTVTLDPFDELRKNLEMIASGGEGENKIKFSINKQAGVLIVFAKQRDHRAIARFVNLLLERMKIQVLVEIKIYDVHLYSRFSTGIDLARGLGLLLQRGGMPINMIGENGISISGFQPQYTTKNINGLEIETLPILNAPNIDGTILKVLREKGVVQSMSNPRLLISNNNVGIFKVVENQVFFRLKHTNNNDGLSQMLASSRRRMPSNNFSQSITTSEIDTVPVGIIILIQPSIDANGKTTISMKIVLSSADKTVNDPAASIMSKNTVKNKVPIVNVQESSTVFEAGDMIVMGGLVLMRKKNSNSGFPPLSGGFEKLSEKHEIVFIIKTKVIKPEIDNYENVFLDPHG